MLRRAAKTITNFLLPPTCGLCREVVEAPDALCGQCWGAVSFIQTPWCDCCGQPSMLPLPAGSLCAACLAAAPLYQKSRAALAYDDASRQLIARFKYGDQLHLLSVFTPWLVRAAAELREGADVVVPVPLWRWRLWHRRFNQSALLARAAGQGLQLPVLYHALQRTRPTRPQVGMTRAERLKNVRDAFTAGAEVKDKVVILVDDVYTTGATLEACTQALLAAGASAVRVLTLARVIRPEQMT